MDQFLRSAMLYHPAVVLCANSSGRANKNGERDAIYTRQLCIVYRHHYVCNLISFSQYCFPWHLTEKRFFVYNRKHHTAPWDRMILFSIAFLVMSSDPAACVVWYYKEIA